MKALRIMKIGAPIEQCEVPAPIPGYGEVLVRVEAAGVCHSDVHYRNGTSKLRSLPLTPGHEVAGRVEEVGPEVTDPKEGDRVCIHYLRSCGRCVYCNQGREQFCLSGRMIGKDCDGGYAELLVVPARNAFRLPDSIPAEQGAVMMCSSATALHALRKARLAAGESVAVFGIGGLGMSAIQIAQAMAARRVFAVDIDPSKLELAESLGALPIDAKGGSAVRRILEATGGRGVDISLELIGRPETMRQSVECLAILGRAALAGITDMSFPVDSYRGLIGKEAEIIGVSDHLASEIPSLIDLVANGQLALGSVIGRRVPLEAAAVNEVLDNLERYASPVRTVIVP